MAGTQGNRGEKRFTGWHMLAVLVGGFSVVIAANVTLAVFATRSWTGLVVPSSYVASQQYNRLLAQAKEQAARGWRGEVLHGAGELRFELTDRDGKALPTFEVAALVGRPSHEGEDRYLELNEIGPGVYRAGVDLDQGIWNVDVLAKGPAGATFREVYRLFVDRDG